MAAVNYLGLKFGKLIVIARDQNPPPNSNRSYWICQCECGNQTSVRCDHLRTGNTTSCGCSHWDHKITHGMYKTKEYKIWKWIKSRCYSKNDNAYNDYGGRGIIMSDEWKNSFENFYKDMGPKPFPEASIERKDVNKGYNKDNCIWIHKNEQQRNTRRTRIKNMDQANLIRNLYETGKFTQKQIAEFYNVSEGCIAGIIKNRNWI